MATRLNIKILVSNFIIFCFLVSWSENTSTQNTVERLPQTYRTEAENVIKLGGDNQKELITAIAQCPEDQLEALGFLLVNMPERDLRKLSAEFLLKNIRLANDAMDSVKWSKSIPNDIFLNYILPYISLHERRDDWRKDFFDNFLPLDKDLQSPA